MAGIRQEKVGKLIAKELAIIFQQHAKDMFSGAMISVTVVRMSPDLGVAKVYLSFFAPGGINKDEFLGFVRSRASVIRGLLGKKIGKHVRSVPELIFFLDDSLDYAESIDNLLKD